MLPIVFATLLVQDPPILHQTFAQNEEGWVITQVQGAGAKLTTSHEEAHMREGKPSLEMDYKIASGQMAIAVLPVARGSWSKVGSVHFWFQSQESGPVFVVLQEHEGGRYVATFTAPKGKWQEVSIGLDDFSISTDKDAPKDPDGKLDPDQIEGVSLADFTQFIAQDPKASATLGIAEGDRSLFLSDFSALAAKPPATVRKTADEVMVDTYSQPQTSWIAFGNTTVTPQTASPVGRGVRADYHVDKTHTLVLVKPFAPGLLTGMASLEITAAASKDTTLLVQVEETSGGKYNMTMPVKGGSVAKNGAVAFAGFMPSDDSKDDDGKLDVDQIKQIVIIDASGFIDQFEGDNTLFVGAVVAKK